jgi:hypothetical protein
MRTATTYAIQRKWFALHTGTALRVRSGGLSLLRRRRTTEAAPTQRRRVRVLRGTQGRVGR